MVGDAHETAPYVPLPPGLRDPARTAGRVFDGVARDYDAARPGYPPAAIRRVQAACNLGPGSHALEVGCGTGQATRSLAPSGCRIRCLEPGENMAALARRNLAAWANVEIQLVTFEEAQEPPGTYDAVVSATAFHWVDAHIGYRKAAMLLRPGGRLVLLTNSHVEGGTEDVIGGAARELHRQLAPELDQWRYPSIDDVRQRAASGGDIAAVWARMDRKLVEPPDVTGEFQAPEVAIYPWLATYGRDAYLTMLGTQSTYALMDADRRARLMEGLGRLIDDRLGGMITKQYACVVAMAARHG